MTPEGSIHSSETPSRNRLTLSDKLQKLQNRAVRVLTHSSYDADANQLITDLGWDNLEIRR